jgi:DNA repair exonuclease SbcCD ATPase subunit
MTLRQVIHSGPAKANELFARLAETGDGAVKTRERLVAELKAELELLAGLEEQHLFPALRKRPETKALAADALADNKQVRALLAELEPMPKEGQDFPAKLAELRKAFQRHVRDEKRELLPAVAKALSEEEAQTVAEKIAAGKADAEEAQREEAERQRAEARREREEAAAEQAKREEAERQQAEAKRKREEAEAERAKQEEVERQQAEAKRKREEAEQAKRQAAEAEQARREQARREQAERQEAEAAERRARQAAAAVTRPVEVAAQGGLRAVEAGGAAAEAGADIAARGSRQAADAAGQAVRRTAAAASGAARRYQAAASQVFKAEGGFAGFWLELVREQVAHNAETFGKLAATRDLGEAFELQGTLVRRSFERLGRLNGRYLETVQAVLTATSSAVEGTDQAA